MDRRCKKAGVRAFRFHAIRYLTANIMYRAGPPVSVIQAMLRQKSPQTTTRHLQSLGLKQTQEAMEAVMGNRGPGKIISTKPAAEAQG
ncbi:tyrosine-type recombinase/integrase [Desulfovibrio sp. TomC]|uniref:tyrosine-type recombinase/integrase n=1 Tax=Desulfovibrio sp. TomC TaxID=1562888 RepID=UPI0005BD8224|nr:tyrosine-type recombinase/integrase [Desulfovibrio sp. TomC]